MDKSGKGIQNHMSFEEDMCKECQDCKHNIVCFDIRYGNRTDKCWSFEAKERKNDRGAKKSR